MDKRPQQSKTEVKNSNIEILLSGLSYVQFMAKKSMERFVFLYHNAAIKTQSLYNETLSVQKLMCNKTWHQEFVLPTPSLSKAPNGRTHFIFFSLKVEIKISLLLRL